MVLGPTEPFTSEEITTLDRYATRGGHLLLALDPDAVPASTATVQAEPTAGAAATPGARPKPKPAAATDKPVTAATKPGAMADGGVASAGDAGAAPAEPPPPISPAVASGSTRATLQALSRLVGIQYAPEVLANDKQHLRRRYNDADRTILMTNRFSSHASVSTLSRNSGRAAAVVLGAGSLEPIKGAPGKVDITLRSMPGTFADKNANYQPDADENKTVFNLAAAVSRPITKPGETPKPADTAKKPGDKAKPEDKSKAGPEEMRAFVIADADVFSDVALTNAMYNQLLLVDAVRWLGGEESFAGAVNTEEDVRIEHTKQADLVWFYTTIFGVPALVLGAGLIYSRHSRRSRGGKR
jgi:hypothetical protein